MSTHLSPFFADTKRGQENEARDVVMRLMRKLNGKRLTEIAEEFSLTGYSPVNLGVESTLDP